MAESGRVLVLGDDNRSCLAVVRSLGRQGLEIWLGTEIADSIVSHSRYVARTISLPSTRLHVEEWLTELQSLLSREPFELVIPCSDNALVPLCTRRERFAPLARLAIPDQVGFEHSYLKSRTMALAGRLGVPAPATALVESAGALADLRLNSQLRLPLIVKPVSSKIWKGGARFDLKVRKAEDSSSLAALVNAALELSPVLVQSYFEGRGVGQEFLAVDGEILDAFQHERVHEPLAGGGSSYRRSVPLDDRLLESSRRLLQELRWTGVAMVEYKQNPATGNFVLMEINGRFWGSLPLAMAAGVDFPYHLYQVLTKRANPRTSSYLTGVYCRNLGRDLRWFQERLRTGAGPSSRILLVAAELVAGAKNLLSGREHFDTITLDDPAPGAAELWNGLIASTRKLARRAGGRARGSAVSLLSSTKAWRRFERLRLRRLLRANPRILFVCRGNICRSPFAEAYANQRLSAAGLSSIQTSSAGSYPVAGRPSPDVAREVSREFGVSLEDNRSRVLDSTLTEWAGAVVCMDARDEEILRSTFPGTRGKLFYLGPFNMAARQVLIADPWNEPAEVFRQCYAEVAASIDGLVQAVRG